MKKIISLLLSLLLVMSCVSCTSSESGESETETERAIAEPSIGIGREEIPDPVVPRKMTICVDPGHGFVDGGTGEGIFADGTLEKDITLAVSTYLSEALVGMGFTVRMTHDGNTFPKSSIDDGNQIYNTYERSSYAGTLDIDYFVSVHVNAYPTDTSVRGSKLYVYETDSKNEPWSEEITNYIITAIENNMPDEPIPALVNQKLEESFVVLRETKVPSTLVELGFCTNPTDAANMTDPEWQKKFAESIANGILDFYMKSGEFELD